MVAFFRVFCARVDIVSVLALSSRFDGQDAVHAADGLLACFSTRSVESF